MTASTRNGPLLAVSAKWIGLTHTALAYAAFLGALMCGVTLHYKKIVRNEHFGFPDEWFPSVSATIGDEYPERNLFQVLIALTSGPRFALIGLWYLSTRHQGLLPKFVAAAGLFRTLLCGGWVYVTSTDDHNAHDVFMIGYLVATIPWTIGVLATSPANKKAIQYRKVLAALFFGTMVPLIYFFIQHKVHRVAGAYTIYAFLEWSLILYDVAFDAVATIDFEAFSLQIVKVDRPEQGYKDRYLPLEAVRSSVVVHLLTKSSKIKERGMVEIQALSLYDAVDFAARLYLGFTFWSILTSLGVMIWYFPLWNMGISGYEVSLLSTIAPFLLGFGQVHRFVNQYPQIFHLLSMLGVAAYAIHSPRDRLLAVSFANMVQTTNWASILHRSRSQPSIIERDIVALLLGLVLSSIAKMSLYANNPIWPIMHSENGGWNKTGLVLGILASLLVHYPPPVVAGDVAENRDSTKKPSPLMSAFAIGGIVFGLHSLLSDSSTIILWVWDGYPVRGPLVVPHGAVTVVVMLLGIYAGISIPSVASSWLLYAIGCVGTYLLYSRNEWLGYAGGMILTAYLTASAPAFLAQAARSPPGRTFGFAFTIYNLLCLGHVWVVAYAFVPGGPLLRERTDLLLIAMMSCIGCGVWNMSTLQRGQKFARPISHYATRKNKMLIQCFMAVIVTMACSTAYWRFPKMDYSPYHPEEKLFTAGIWTVHFGLDNDMWASEVRMRDIIKELELDIIGLLESDLQRIIMGNRDLTQFISEDLGMYADFGPGPNKHTWGAALLSKFPIVESTHYLLPSPVGELAPAIHATLDVFGTLVDVIVSHNGQEEDPEDRRLQSTMLGDIMRNSSRPFVFLGYVVSVPGEYPQKYLTDGNGMNDIEPTDWDRWCEYILFRGLRRVAYARVDRSTITDTELQTGKFMLQDPSIAASYQRIDESAVPAGCRYPDKFKGEGVRGHKYNNNRVITEPWYYS